MVIDKKWFYWLEVIEKLGWLVWWIKAILLMGLCLYGFFIILAYIECNVWDDWGDWEKNKGKLLKGFKIPAIAFVLVSIISIFLPTKQTLVQMKVAEQITYENIDYSIEIIKDTVDYIFEKVGK